MKLWAAIWDGIDRDLEGWARHIAADEMPLPTGEARRLSTLINGFRSVQGMDPARAQVAARLARDLERGVTGSQGIAGDALGPHVIGAAEQAASLVGSHDLVNERALRAVVDGVTGDMAKDFSLMADHVQRKMIADLTTSIVAGDGARDLAKRIAKSIRPTFGTAQSRSLRIARTQLARAYDVARFEVYAEAGNRELIYGWEWIANGSNTCDVCAALDGSVWPPDEDTYRHPNCVCSTVPVLHGSPEAETPFGENARSDQPGTTADVERVTSASGWTHWQMKRKPSKTPPKPKGRTKRAAPKSRSTGRVRKATPAPRKSLTLAEKRAQGRQALRDEGHSTDHMDRADAKRAELAGGRWLTDDDMSTVMEVGRDAKASIRRRVKEWADAQPIYPSAKERRARRVVEARREVAAARGTLDPADVPMPKLHSGKPKVRKVAGVDYQMRAPTPMQVDGVRDTLATYPGEWVEDGAALFRELTVYDVDRGWFSEYGREMALSIDQRGSSAASVGRVAAHEYGHAMEATRRNLTIAEQKWWKARVGDDVTLVARDGAWEAVLPENPTRDWYTLKRYSSTGAQDTAYEVFTTGVEEVLGGSAWDRFLDDDLEEFIMGALLCL